MGWRLDDDEMRRVLKLSVDERYAYAINQISEHGSLWTLKSDAGWVPSTTSEGVSSIPIWPHERFAALETTALWSDATPVCLSLADDWLTDDRAAWFADNELVVSVFLAGSTSKTVDYATLVELIRGERRERYLRGRRSSRTARDPKRSTRVTTDLVTYVNDREIDFVIERVPLELRTRIRDIRRRRSSDAKVLGSVSTRGRRDIELSARLPIRVSLGRYLVRGQSPAEFGAPDVGQWPPWAVRRFLLYDVLFHEIGHLQIVASKAPRVQRKFAGETRAQAIADELRRTLYSEPFDHSDPIHNAPTAEELAMLPVWNRLDKQRRAELVALTLGTRRPDNALLSVFEPMTNEQRGFLARVFEARSGR
jgi:hypothetical protein